MIIKKWNDDWYLWKNIASFALAVKKPATAESISLPYDAMIHEKPYAESKNGTKSGYRDGAIYHFQKTFQVPGEYRYKTLMLKFEGVYMCTFVYINNQLAAQWPNGYSTIIVPLNDYLIYGEENTIRVTVKNSAMGNSRWYSGSGIYRDVYWLESPHTYIEPGGVQVCTEHIHNDYAGLLIQTKLFNGLKYPRDLYIETVIMDPSGKQVANDDCITTLFADRGDIIKQRVVIDSPCLWDEDNPNMYTCITKIYEDKMVLDTNRTHFGIRSLQLDVRKGLRVNGKPKKLRGACIHHDSGLLGAATYDDAAWRQIKKLKEAGFNAVRMAHHPMAPALLRACDALGMYVMDEAFDMWTHSKADYDYSLYFNDWWERDITSMVIKNFNHPSVILYSTGNEIPELGTDEGIRLNKMLSDKIHTLDPSRYTLTAINGVFSAGARVDQLMGDTADAVGLENENINVFMTLMSNHMDELVKHPIVTDILEKNSGCTDVLGYNYMTSRYESDVEQYQNRLIVGSETYPPDIGRIWPVVESLPQVIGDFTWTGWDYIGEAGIGVPAYKQGEGGFDAKFPCQLAYCGDFDITGYRRPLSYFREIVFGLRQDPYIAVQNPNYYGKSVKKTHWIMSDSVSTWDWPGLEGKPTIVEVYAVGDEVELFQDGISCGKMPVGKSYNYIAIFEVVYQKGILTAVAYKNGDELGRMTLRSAIGSRKLSIIHELPVYMASKETLIFIDIVMTDSEGTVFGDDFSEIRIDVDGPAELIGFGSGNPKPLYNYDQSITTLFYGRALAILKTIGETGLINVQVKGNSSRNYSCKVNIPIIEMENK